jgi:hypothetical protein
MNVILPLIFVRNRIQSCWKYHGCI